MAENENSTILTLAAIRRGNIAKKRPSHPDQTNDEVAKRNKAAGDPYRSRNGKLNPGILPPTNAKACGRCTKIGCQLSGVEKRRQFAMFRALNYDGQSAALVQCIQLATPAVRTVLGQLNFRRKHTYIYSVTVNGVKQEVCIITLMVVFGISEDRIRTIKKKLEAGEIVPKDQRGKHENHKTVSEEVKEHIRNHIRMYPLYESHYSRARADVNRRYLDPELTLTKMYCMFIEFQRASDLPEAEKWLYDHIFHQEFPNIRISRPKSDTCDVCDRFRAEITDGTQEERAILELNRDLHHTMSKEAFDEYKSDVEKATLQEDYVVLTIDLQQVIFTPGVTASKSFYLRKLSNYNLAICQSNDKKTVMNLWNELEGGRGSNEISSCLWKFIVATYERTPNRRHLVVWFDRCIGQNNNSIVLTTMMKLVRASYFTSMEQKFFVTGHSYNVCDRHFGVIEAKMRHTTLLVPSDIEALIQEAAQDNPYTVQNVTQEDILGFKELSVHAKFPSYFRITKQLYYKYSMKYPNFILSKSSYSPMEPLRRHEIRFGNLFNSQPVPQYTETRVLELGKTTDIEKLSEFVSGEAKAYYFAMLEEQRELRQRHANEEI